MKETCFREREKEREREKGDPLKRTEGNVSSVEKCLFGTGRCVYVGNLSRNEARK